MTLKLLPLIGTDSVAVTVENSGLDRVTANGGTTITYDAARGIKLVTAVSTTTVIGANLPAANKQFSFSVELTTPTTVPASGFVSLCSVLNSAGTGLMGIGYTSAKKIILVGAAGALLVLSKTGTNADGTIDPNTSFRIAGVVTIGTSSTTGAFSGHIYNPGSSTPLFSPSPVSNVNLGVTDAFEFRIGEANAGAVYTYGARYLQLNDGSTTELAEWIPAVPLGAVNNLDAAATKPTGSATTDGKLKITWDPVSNAHHYELRWAPGLGATSGWTTIANAAIGYEITNLAAGDYTIQVRAKAA